MSAHRYPRSAVTADFVRATAGFVLSAGPLVVATPGVAVSAALAVIAGLFAAFAARTAVRFRLALDCSETGLTICRIKTKNLNWEALHTLDLRYYAVKRDRTQGWMQLTLKSAGTVLRLESTLDGFDVVARTAAVAAQKNGVALSSATLANLEAIGIKVVTPNAQGVSL